MISLTTRLREWATSPMYALICRQLREAADEIERLQAESNGLAALLRELIDIEGPQPGHVMWFQKVSAALAKLRPDYEAIAAAPQLRGKKALVLYFETDQDVDEFTALILEAKPGMRAVKIP